MSKVITEIPTLTLSRERVYNNAEMVADIPRVLSGNTLAQYVHATGNPVIDSGTRALDSMRSPSGAFGHDHSGGNHGRPLRRSVFSHSQSFRDNHGYTGYNEEYSSSIKQNVTNRFYVDLRAAPNTVNNAESYTVSAWIPPCDKTGTYNELSFSAKFFKQYSLNLLGSDDFEITVHNVTTGSTSTFDGDDLLSSTSFIRDSNDLLRCKQGAINEFRFSVKIDTTSSGSERSVEIGISEFNLYVNT